MAAKTHTFSDKQGRQVTIRKIRGAERMALFRMLGDQSTNMMYAGQILFACAVDQIDDRKLAPIGNLKQAEALIEELDDDFGTFDLVGTEYGKAFNETPAAVREAAKN